MTDDDRTPAPTGHPDTPPATPPASAAADQQGQPPAPYQQAGVDQRRARGRRRVVSGVLWLAAGLLITVITLANAGRGGVYVVAFGPMLYGVYQIVAGAWLHATHDS